MADDVAQKLIEANDVKSGHTVTGADRSGNFFTLAPTNITDVPLASGLETSLTNRFDDPTYYTA